MVLLVGWLLGSAAARVVTVTATADRIRIGRAVLGTPLGRIPGGTEAAVSNTFGWLAERFVFALAIDLLSQRIQTAVSFLPAFVAGLLVIVLGFVTDEVGDAIMRARTATQTAYTG